MDDTAFGPGSDEARVLMCLVRVIDYQVGRTVAVIKAGLFITQAIGFLGFFFESVFETRACVLKDAVKNFQ